MPPFRSADMQNLLPLAGLAGRLGGLRVGRCHHPFARTALELRVPGRQNHGLSQ